MKIYLILPLYCGRSSIFNQAAISKCGGLGNTIIGFICFLLNVENRKLHAMPVNKIKNTAIILPISVHFYKKSKFFNYICNETETAEQINKYNSHIDKFNSHIDKLKCEQTLLWLFKDKSEKTSTQSNTETDWNKVLFHELTYKWRYTCNISVHTFNDFSKYVCSVCEATFT